MMMARVCRSACRDVDGCRHASISSSSSSTGCRWSLVAVPVLVLFKERQPVWPVLRLLPGLSRRRRAAAASRRHSRRRRVRVTGRCDLELDGPTAGPPTHCPTDAVVSSPSTIYTRSFMLRPHSQTRRRGLLLCLALQMKAQSDAAIRPSVRLSHCLTVPLARWSHWYARVATPNAFDGQNSTVG